MNILHVSWGRFSKKSDWYYMSIVLLLLSLHGPLLPPVAQPTEAIPSIKFRLYSPYSIITICPIVHNKVRHHLSQKEASSPGSLVSEHYITFHLADAFIQSDFQLVHQTMRVQTQNNKNQASTIFFKKAKLQIALEFWYLLVFCDLLLCFAL